jgi:diguanylate cyclase (GGDEF)-like protein
MSIERSRRAGAEVPGDQSPRVVLGWALHARADDVATGVLARLARTAGPQVTTLSAAVPEAIATADRLATRVFGRWLATGEQATEAEHEVLAGPGTLVDEVALPILVKAYLAWRDVLVEILLEEGARLRSPPELLDEARQAVDRSCDASLVRMVREFELQRRRLEAELAGQQAKLAHQALHDHLTGLPNRLLLYDRIELALRGVGRAGGTVALLFVDLDGFKAVNDRFGHAGGDHLLVSVADRLRAAVRPADTVARLGGDEFIVLCDRLEAGEAGLAAATAVADRALSGLRPPFALGAAEAVLSASIGIALAGPGEVPEDLVRRADGAMYAAKRRGDAHEHAPGPDEPANAS